MQFLMQEVKMDVNTATVLSEIDIICYWSSFG